MIDPTGALFHLFMLMVYDKKIGNILSMQNVHLVGNDVKMKHLTFGKLKIDGTGEWLVTKNTLKIFCRIDKQVGILDYFF